MQRTQRVLALAAWASAIGVFATQVWVLLDRESMSIRTLFPDWPREPAYNGYLRGIAWADVLFSQPLLFVTGIGLWRVRRWAWIAGVAYGCAAVYFTILQIAAQFYIGGAYNLYSAGIFAQPLAGTSLEPLVAWIGLLPFVVFPVGLGIYCVGQLRRWLRPNGGTAA